MSFAGRESELQSLGVDLWHTLWSEECLLAFMCFKVLGAKRRPEFPLIPLGGARLLKIASCGAARGDPPRTALLHLLGAGAVGGEVRGEVRAGGSDRGQSQCPLTWPSPASVAPRWTDAFKY